MTSSGDTWVEYDYAVVRVVPRVHLGTFVNVGVVLHARQAGFLDTRWRLEPEALAPLCPPTLSVALIERYLKAYACVGRGGPHAGPIGLLPPSERFHWMTAPRSTVLQTSDLHAGRTRNPAATLDALFEAVVGRNA